MKLLVNITLALAMLAPCWITSARAASPSLTAQSTLEVLTFEPKYKIDGGNLPSKKVAIVTDELERELASGFLASGSIDVQVEMGAIHMYANCTGNKGGAGQCELTGKYTDAITVNSRNSENGFLKLSGKVNGENSGGGSAHGGDISLKITVHNSGSTAHPKNVDILLTYFDGWGDSQIDLAPLEDQQVAVQKSDRLTISAVQVMKTHAISNGSYVFDVANYHDTSHFYIDCLAADFSITADSGHDYSTPRTAVQNSWVLYE